MDITVKCVRSACVGLVLTLGGAAAAQTAGTNPVAKERIVIFADRGRVNHATGSSLARHTVNGPERPLAVGEDLSLGDVVQTGAGAQLEVLLNPGSYFRVAENTQFQIAGNSLRGIRIYLSRGSAVVENGNSPYQVFSIQVLTPLGMALFEGPGIFRVNVSPGRAEYLSVYGNFTLGSRTVNLTTAQQVTVDGAGAGPITSFDPKATPDGLEIWSRSRAEALAKANRKLDGGKLAAAMQLAAADENLNAALQEQSGFWANSSRHDFAVFVPFHPKFWRSPYGFDYTNGNGAWQSDPDNPNTAVTTRWPTRAPSAMPSSQETKPRGIRVTPN